MKGTEARARPFAGAALVVATTLALAACGGSSDKNQITQIIKDYGNHPTKLCTQYADAFMIRAQFATKAHCLAAASAPGAADPRVKVDSVSVKGKNAIAVRTSGSNPGLGTKATIYLIKGSAGWKIDAVIPRAS